MGKTGTVALVTWDQGTTPDGAHQAMADGEDAAIAAALAARGLTVERRIWSDPTVAWAGFDLVMIRTTWDYYDRIDAFLAWLDATAAVAPVWNPPAVVRWNADKRYLFDLAARGVTLPPTVRLSAGAAVDLGGLMAERGWAEVVVKRAVGAGASGQLRIARGAVGEGQPRLDALLAAGDLLVQPFLASIVARGEVSLVTVNGEPVHAVRKVPAAGDYRSQPNFGSRVVPHAPEPAEVELARRALAAVGRPVLHGRVDMVTLDDGRPALMELELIEPFLFLRDAAAGAVERVADGIVARLGAPSER